MWAERRGLVPQVLDNMERRFGRVFAQHRRVIDGVTNQIEHYMDLLSARQKLVASNIANIDTPGYKAKDIDFQFEFMSLTQNSQAPHVSGALHVSGAPH